MIYKIIKAIENRGFLTGSRALWGVTEESDWDYVLETEDFEKILHKIIQINYPYTEIKDYDFSLTGIYFEVDGKKFNLINCTSEQYKIWYVALQMLKQLPDEWKAITNKEQRKQLYQGIVFELEYLYKKDR